MTITILAPEDIDFKEKEIQSAFEQDLSKLEDGLEFVKSELVIGTGRIDTLAFDTNTSSPVFIEYKRRGHFGKDALIQLMEYLSWFAKDENRMTLLEKLIRQQKPDVDEVEPSIRLICVVSDIDDQIRNAIYAITNHVKVYSYTVAHDTAGKLVLVPKLEVDNSEIEPPIPEVKSEADILKKYPQLQQLFSSLREELEKDGASGYTTAKSFRFKKIKIFAKLHFRKKYIMLELRVGQRKITDNEFVYWRGGESQWGYVYIFPGNAIPDKVVKWIEIAKNYSAQSQEENDETEES
jgi:hypothetical protein